jgi:hypothetical protein
MKKVINAPQITIIYYHIQNICHVIVIKEPNCIISCSTHQHEIGRFVLECIEFPHKLFETFWKIYNIVFNETQTINFFIRYKAKVKLSLSLTS